MSNFGSSTVIALRIMIFVDSRFLFKIRASVPTFWILTLFFCIWLIHRQIYGMYQCLDPKPYFGVLQSIILAPFSPSPPSPSVTPFLIPPSHPPSPPFPSPFKSPFPPLSSPLLPPYRISWIKGLYRIWLMFVETQVEFSLS